MPSINICCLVIMFYLTKKSCSDDVLKFWKYNFLLVLLVDAVRAWRGETERRFPFSSKGPWAHREITWESDTVRWYSEQKIGYENSVWYKISLPEMKLPSPRTDPSSSASPGLNRRAVSASVIPTIPIPELDTIQCMKNSTIMNQNKRLLSRMLFF